MPYDLFPLLHNRLSRENQVVPQYIGEFDCIEALPSGQYPAIYYWMDKSCGGGVRLTFNTPLLEAWCMEEALLIGVSIGGDDEAVQRAIKLLQQVAALTFQNMLSNLD